MKLNRKLTLSVFICAGVLSLYPINEIHVKAADTTSIENTADNDEEKPSNGTGVITPQNQAIVSQQSNNEKSDLKQQNVDTGTTLTSDDGGKSTDIQTSDSTLTKSGQKVLETASTDSEPQTPAVPTTTDTNSDSDDNGTGTSTYPEIDMPVYEVNNNDLYDSPSNYKHQIGVAHLTDEFSVYSTMSDKTIIYYGVKSNLKDGMYGTDKTKTYKGWYSDLKYYYNAKDKKLYDEEPFNESTKLKGLCFQITSGYFNLNFVDSDTNQIISKSKNEVYVNNGDLNSDDFKAAIPAGYALKSGQTIKYDVNDPDTMTKDVQVYKVKPYLITVNKKVTGKGTSASTTENLSVPVSSGLPEDIFKLSKNTDYNPVMSLDNANPITVTMTDPDGSSETVPVPDKATLEILKGAFKRDVDDSDIGSSYVFTVNYTYDDDANPIKWNVVIPSNKIDQPVPTVLAQGKLGQKVVVKVPQVAGYTADKTTIQATVGADGIITADESVKYTKTPNSHHSSSNTHHFDNDSNSSDSNNEANDENITDTNVSLGTIDQADVYDNNGNKQTAIISPLNDFTANEKMVKDNETYYRIGNNKWVKASDTYIYEKFNGFVRTYENSDKPLIDVEDEPDNRDLVPLTDWKTDRYADFNNEKYYRVATDEWIKASDVFTYQPKATVIDTNAGTILFNDHGKAIGSMNKEMKLKSDLVANIDNQPMYRVATNEYVLVSDIK